MKKQILLLLTAIFLLGGNVMAQFAGGTGIEGDPWLIETPEQLNEVRNNLSAHFRLENDIDLTDYLATTGDGYNSGAFWQPIGEFKAGFTGDFDGNGFAIKGLKINRPSQYFVGLFADISGTVYNLGVEIDGEVVGKEFVGGLAGALYANATVYSCYAIGEVKGEAGLGGLIGGAVHDGNNVVSNCYAMVNVTRLSGSIGSVGGFVGENFRSEITNSYSTGWVKDDGGNILTDKGFCGLVDTGTGYSMSGNFWDTQTSGATSTAGDATGKTTAEMKQEATFTAESWDFSTIWGIEEGVTYPYLLVHAPLFAGGDGTSGDPFRITTPEELNNVRLFLGESHSNKHFILMNDIDLSDYLDDHPEWGADGWLSIGHNYDNSFRGIFDGNNKEISGLWINRSGVENMGLFGYIVDGKIKNLGIVLNDNIIGGGSTGALVGRINYDNDYSLVQNCYVTGSGSIVGIGNVGGIAGYMSNSGNGIIGCYVDAGITVTGMHTVGGLVGFISTLSFVESSYSKSNVFGEYLVGGLVGNLTNQAQISNSYSRGNVTFTDEGFASNNGGFVGAVNTSTIENCYSTGWVSFDGTQQEDKGFVGSNSGGTFLNNFWDIETSEASSTGGDPDEYATGLTTSQMNAYGTFHAAGWDFIDEDDNGTDYFWGINLEENNGYPFLAWQGYENNPLFTEGDGTEDNPFAIYTPEDLNMVRNYLGATHDNKHFILMNDINLEDYLAEGGAGHDMWGDDGWLPIGDDDNRFEGNFDGGENKITGLKIVRSTVGYIGLFGHLGENASVYDLGVIIDEDSFVRGNYYVGGLAAQNRGNVERCYVIGKVQATSSTSYAGVLVGINRGNISMSYAIGSISGQMFTGGLVGFSIDPGIINDCYAIVDVARSTGSTTLIGGFIGRNDKSKIFRSYSVGKVTDELGNTFSNNGFCGSVITTGNYEMSGNYWDVETSGADDTACNATGLTTIEMKLQGSFTGWDFADTWAIVYEEDNGVTVSYPYLAENSQDPASGLQTLFEDGDGSEGNPWQITNAEQLNNVRHFLGAAHNDKHFELMNDVDLTAFIDNHPDMGDEGWLPIGSDFTNSFRGNFNGDGSKITGLWIDREEGMSVGLFGFIVDGEINDLGLEINGLVKGGEWVGGLVGRMNDGNITNSYVTGGRVYGLAEVGGLAGQASLSEITNSYATVGEVSGIYDIGGFIGYAIGSNITNSYALGVVEGNGPIGGLVGRLYGYSLSVVNNCYTMVNVTRSSGDDERVGGFVGVNYQGIITNSYSTGSVHCDTEGLLTGKGFCGEIDDGEDYQMSGNFWDTQTSGADETAGEATGLTTAEMKLHIPFDAAEWDFDEVWSIVASDGEVSYPYLTDNPQDPAPGLQDAHLVEFSTTGNGDITAKVGETAFDSETYIAQGADITFTATPDEYYGVDEWSVNGIPQAETGNTFIYPDITEDITVTVEFKYFFEDGDGSEGDPFQITNAEQLNNVRQFLGAAHNDKHFILMTDVDLIDFIDNHPDMGEDGWLPIGHNYTNSFRGTFDGGNNKITGLWIDRESTNNVGLFGYVRDGEISDLGVEIDGSVIGNSQVGGLVGYLRNSDITNCYVSGGEIYGTSYRVGGLVGWAEIAEINNCHATDISVEGDYYVGGLFGRTDGGVRIMYSYALGAVEGESYLGGLVGLMGAELSDEINDCYAMVNVTRGSGDSESVGGFVGYNYRSTITNSYSTGSVFCVETDNYLTDKGFYGSLVIGGDFDMSGNFWDTQTSQASSTGGDPGEYATGLTTAEMKLQLTFEDAGWDFEDVWSIVASGGEVSYPLLIENPQIPEPGLQDAYIVSFSSVGNGTLSVEVGVTEIETGMLIASGADIVFNAAPDADYMVEWEVNTVTLEVYSLTYTIESLEEDTEVIVSFSPIVVDWPEASSITYGQPLSESNFSSALTNLDGEFEFNTPDAILAAGTYDEVAVTFTPDDTENYGPVSGTVTVVVEQKELTVINAEAQDKDYDGNTNAVITDAELDGVIGTDDVTLEDHTMGTFAQATVGTGISVTTAMKITGDDAPNYTLTQPGYLQADINKKELTVINAEVTPKVYDGTAIAAITGAELDGVVGSDDVTLEGHTMGTFAQVTVGDGISVATTMTISGAAHGNYSLTQPTLTGNITHRELTITPNSFNKTEGHTYVFQGTEFTTDNLVAGDEVTEVELTSTGAAAGAGLGEHDIVITSGSEEGTGLDNYNISYETGTLTVVDQTEVTLDGLAVNSRVYDGTTDATVSNWGTLDGVEGGHQVVLDHSSAVATFDSKHVGTDKDVTVSGLALSGDDADKYYINNHIVEADITTRTLTPDNFVASPRVYDGTTDVTGTGFGDDRIGGDELFFTYEASFADKHVGEDKPVSFTDITIDSGADMDNYHLETTTGTAHADIDPKELNVVNTVAQNKTYDGNDVAMLEDAELSTADLIGGDDVILGNHTTGTFVQVTVGVDIEVTTGMTISGDDAHNYDLIQPDGLEADIEQRPLTITANSFVKPYGELYEFDGTEFTTDNLVAGDEVTEVELTSDGAPAEAEPGNYAIVITPDSEDGTGLENYIISHAEGNLSVRKEISVDGLIADNKVYDGTTDATISDWGSLDGVTEGDDVTLDHSSAVAEFDSKDVGAGIDVTVTGLELAGDDADFYMLTEVVVQADITAKQLTIGGSFTVHDKVYDGTTEAEIDDNSLTLTGIVNDEDVDIDNIVAEFADAAVGGNIEVSIVSADLVGDDRANYRLSYEGSPTTTANIFAITHTVTFSVEGTNGTLIAEVDGTAISSGDDVEEGQDVEFTATPNEGFIIKEWTLNGVVVTGHTGLIYTVENLDDDIEVTVEFEEKVGIPQITKVEISVYPNPSRDKFTVRSSEMIEKIRLVNISGQVVIDIKVEDMQTEINVNNLHPGLFFMQIHTAKGIVTERVQVAK